MDESKGLFQLDPVTGMAWDFHRLPFQFSVVGLEFDAARQVLLAANGSSLIEIEPMSGAAVVVGDFGVLHQVNDLAFVPPCP